MADDKKRSWVWSYFEKEGDKCKCILCSTFVSFKGYSTGTMTRHLNSVHKKFSEAQTADIKSKMPSQESMSAYVRKPMKRETYTNITRKAVMMCIKDLRPLSIVEGEGFQEFCKALNPDYEVSENSHLSHIRSTRASRHSYEYKNVV